jgi:hypothetical protein
MSERDDIRLRKRFNCAPLWLVVWLVFLSLVFTSVLVVASHSELRDLQRRVGQLESERR